MQNVLISKVLLLDEYIPWLCDFHTHYLYHDAVK